MVPAILPMPDRDPIIILSKIVYLIVTLKIFKG